jgi:SAM-dependent methyltransferase
MAKWDDLFLDERFVEEAPQAEVQRFVKKLEGAFAERPLRVWDLCCGAGRHTLLVARMGHEAFASDISENGIRRTRGRLEKERLAGRLELADMTRDPWGGARLHGAFCWDAIHHNTLANVRAAVEVVRANLLPGGLFMATVISSKAATAGKGREVEKDTLVRDDGPEAGVPHHYFDEAGIRDLFRGWTPLILAEQVITYFEAEPDFLLTNPFAYTKWLVVMRK